MRVFELVVVVLLAVMILITGFFTVVCWHKEIGDGNVLVPIGTVFFGVVTLILLLIELALLVFGRF